jgi:hypothetical protein
VLGLSNFLTLQTFRAKQKHLVRINHTRIPPLRSSRSPLIKFFLRAPNTGTNFVAQGAAPFAGPEAFSLCRRVRRSGDCKHPSVLNAAHTKIAPATLAESALPFLLDLKVFGISTYKINRGGTLMNKNRRSRNGSVVAQVAQAMILGQRDLRLLSCEGAHVAASATPLEYALTQKGGGGTGAQKQIPRAKCALVMTTSARLSRWRAQGAAAGLNVAPGSLARHPPSASGRDDCALTAVGERVV